MASLFTLPKAQAFNSSGDPVPGARLYFYATGTSTPQTVYAESSLNTAHTNPVVADAYGVFPAIWLDAFDYRVTLTDAGGVTQWTIDGVSGTTTGGGGATVSYPITTEETAAGVTPADLTYPVLDIRRYGAVATADSADAATNNTAISNALLVAARTGGRVYVPAAALHYAVSDEFTVPANCSVYGDGLASHLQQYTAEKNIFNLSNDTTVERVYLKGSSAATGSSFAKFNGVFASAVRNIRVLGIYASDWQSAGVQIRDCTNYRVQNCTFFQNDKGTFNSQSDIVVFSLTAGSRGVIHGNHCFSNCDAAGIYINANGYDADATISDNVIVTLADDWTETATASVNRRHGILVSYQGSAANGGRTVVTGNVIRNCKLTGIYRATGAGLAPIYPCLIANNFVSKVGWDTVEPSLAGGIYINNGGAGDQVSNNVIVGFDGAGANGSNPEIHGCIVVNEMDATNSGPIHVTGNYCASSTNAGIVLKNSVRNVYVTNNVCAYNTYNDIVIVHTAADATCGGHVIADNIVQRSASNPYYAGVYLYLQAGATPTYVLRNRLFGGSSSGGSYSVNCGVLLNQGTSDAIVQDNLIRNFICGVRVDGQVPTGRQSKPLVRRNVIHNGGVGIHSNGASTATLHGCAYNSFSDMTLANTSGYAIEVSYVVGGNWVMNSAGVAPAPGAWAIGDKSYSTSVTGVGAPIGWVYTAAGTWTKFGVTY